MANRPKTNRATDGATKPAGLTQEPHKTDYAAIAPSQVIIVRDRGLQLAAIYRILLAHDRPDVSFSVRYRQASPRAGWHGVM